MDERVEKALFDFDAVLDYIGTCGDGGCIVKRPKGMHTNGGCKCATDRFKAQRVMMAAQRLRNALHSFRPEITDRNRTQSERNAG